MKICIRKISKLITCTDFSCFWSLIYLKVWRVSLPPPKQQQCCWLVLEQFLKLPPGFWFCGPGCAWWWWRPSFIIPAEAPWLVNPTFVVCIMVWSDQSVTVNRSGYSLIRWASWSTGFPLWAIHYTVLRFVIIWRICKQKSNNSLELDRILFYILWSSVFARLTE